MFQLDQWQEIWYTITKNKTRSLLTAFGVFWGILLLVLMIGFANGFTNSLIDQFSGINVNSGFLFPRPTSLPYDGLQSGRFWSMNNQDVDYIKANYPEVEVVTAQIPDWSSTADNVVYEDQAGTFSISYVSSTFMMVNPMILTQGRFINALDEMNKRKVCVLGIKIYNDLFAGKGDVLSKLVRVNGIYYRVIGVASQRSTMFNMGSRVSETVYIPLSTGQIVTNAGEDVGMVALSLYKGASSTTFDRVAADIKARHRIDPKDDMALFSFDLSTMLNRFYALFMGLRGLVWLVGIGTLLAGVVGVSNIMLVTVKERTQEIGVRRALGATPRVILQQIMLESLTLTLLAGLFGILVGVGILTLVGSIPLGESGALVTPLISFDVAMSSLLILAFFGLLAGLLPSQRAVQIKAIDALRDE